MQEIHKDLWVSWNAKLKHEFEDLYIIETEEELRSIVEKAKNIRIFGSKQSSADIAAGTSVLIDLTKYKQILAYNHEKKTITVQSGIQLVDLIEAVEAKGWCIPCLPDINTVTLGGAIATGTHGTSGKLLPEYMVSCRLVLGDGTIKEVKVGEDLMDALRVSMGTLGFMSTITMQCEEIYTLHVLEEPQKDEVWLKDLKQKVQSFDFLRILWLPHTNHGYVITGEKIAEDTPIKEKNGPTYLKYRRKASQILYRYSHKFPWITAIANRLLYWAFFTAKKESKGSLYQATVTKSRGSTLELAEWTVALDDFPPLFKELKTELNKWSNEAFVHIPMDVRFVQADKSWLSYAYGKDIVTMGCVTRNAETADNYEAFKTVERIFLKFGGRPHWGKRFEAKDSEMAKLYPKWKDFKNLRKEMDPSNKFLNPYLLSLFNE